jgi:glycosyltransferase involved in cell wall biosynthesis
MQTAKVTVLMPVYNTAPYLKAAIDSILTQTFTDFELLIIDDASTDGSVDTVKTYTDARIKLIEKPQNTGYTNSLNLGLELATGQYVARMDSDDISLPERFAKQVAFMDAHPEVGVCGTWIKTFGCPQPAVIQYPTSHDRIAIQLFSSSQFAHPSVMIRKSILAGQPVRYDQDMEPTEDFDLWVRLSRVTQLANLPEVLLHYRFHQGQVSATRRSRQIEKFNQVRLKQLAELGINPDDNEKELHVQLLDNTLPADSYHLHLVHGWLKKLLSGNRSSRLFEHAMFHRHLLDLWAGIVVRTLDFNIALLQLALPGDFPILGKLSTYQKITFIPKCLLQWKTRV